MSETSAGAAGAAGSMEASACAGASEGAKVLEGASALPLAGRSVVITRTREQADALARPLEAMGAEIVAFPVIAIMDPEDWGAVDAAIEQLSGYDWIVLTSTNAVDRFLARLAAPASAHAPWEVAGTQSARAALAQAGVRVAAVGAATAARLDDSGVAVDLVPEDFRAEGLVDAFRELGAGEGWRVLIPRAAEAREILPETLREMGCEVDVTPVYRTVPAEPDPAALARIERGGIDVVTFTSGSTVRNFLQVLEAAGVDPLGVLNRSVVASVGPVTSAGLHKRGVRVDVEPAESTMSALAEAIAEHFAD
jgi:uroporphyrinogen III methyltransferase / synthase